MPKPIAYSSRFTVFGLFVSLLFFAGCDQDTTSGGNPQSGGRILVGQEAKQPGNTGIPAQLTGDTQLRHPFPVRIPAPSLEGGQGWLNTEKPIALKDLKGKFVLLDFWTYCCINCMHVLPELHKLEQAYPNELVVIGVHSAKFEGEKSTDNIRDAIVRYEIEHPVVNDANMAIWNRYGTRSWPTMVLIDPEGKAVWKDGGEQTFEKLDQLLRKALPYYRTKGLINRTPIRFSLERDKLKPTPLMFPGKILADATGGRLFIADSNHNRIVVTSLEGKLVDVIGSGTIGSKDGDFQVATFNHPQGMAIVGDQLFIADTENHLLRQVDLTKKLVTTIAGTGKQARGAPYNPTTATIDGVALRGKTNNALTTPLNSPWALWPHDSELFIAMAGPHQIWKLTPAEGDQPGNHISAYAGNGREDIVDGPLLPRRPFTPGFSSFAQPSGFASDGKRLFVADSEGSSIRAIPLAGNGEVETLIGTADLPSGRLFHFGDRDGKGLLRVQGPRASFRSQKEQTTGPLLQHALGIAYAEGKLYIADTYNNKIKVLELASGHCSTLAGTGKPGSDNGPSKKATFDEPAGLAVADGKLFVADTNNHTVRMIDLQSGQVSTLLIEWLEP